MADACNTASDAPVLPHTILILTENGNLGESLARMMDRSAAIACVGQPGSLEEAREMSTRNSIHALLLDHPPTPEEKILARERKVPLALLDDNATQDQPEPGVCARMHRNLANTVALELILAHAMEKHFLLKAMEETHAQSRLYREDRETARRLGHIVTMIGVAAHEVNQPLTSLLGHIELINMNRNDTEKILRYMERVDESGDKIAHIVKLIQDLRHEYWVSDNAFERGASSLSVLYAGADSRLFDHLSKVLEPYTKVSLSKGSGNRVPPETDLVLAEFNPGNDWESWASAAKQEEKTVALAAELGHLPAAYGAVRDFRVDAVIPAWASGPETLLGLTQACDVSYFRDKADASQKKMRQVALKDDLSNLVTDLIVRRAVEKEIPRSEKMNRTSSICVMYLENSGEIEEKFGIKALNQSLSVLGGQLRKQASREDLPARVQGSQFTVLLPGRDRNQALDWRRSIGDALAKNPFDWFGKSIQLVVSAGIAEHAGGSPDTLESWMGRAMEALSEARAKGPGSIVVR